MGDRQGLRPHPDGTGKLILPGEQISWDQHIHAAAATRPAWRMPASRASTSPSRSASRRSTCARRQREPAARLSRERSRERRRPLLDAVAGDAVERRVAVVVDGESADRAREGFVLKSSSITRLRRVASFPERCSASRMSDIAV